MTTKNAQAIAVVLAALVAGAVTIYVSRPKPPADKPPEVEIRINGKDQFNKPLPEVRGNDNWFGYPGPGQAGLANLSLQVKSTPSIDLHIEYVLTVGPGDADTLSKYDLSDGGVADVNGQHERVRGICVSLTGAEARNYDISYALYQEGGPTAPASNGQNLVVTAGSYKQAFAFRASIDRRSQPRDGEMPTAKEFQTGGAKRSRGLWHIEQIAHLQDALRRELHPLAIGAAQYRVELAARFSDWTIVDSMPFMKAVHRQKAHRGEWRIHWKSEIGASVDALFSYNAAEWGRWIEDLVATRPWQRQEPAPRVVQQIGQFPLPFAQQPT